jgi:hypothetical protein
MGGEDDFLFGGHDEKAYPDITAFFFNGIRHGKPLNFF